MYLSDLEKLHLEVDEWDAVEVPAGLFGESTQVVKEPSAAEESLVTEEALEIPRDAWGNPINSWAHIEKKEEDPYSVVAKKDILSTWERA